MAITKTHAKRYAKAIFEIALERHELDKWQSDLTRVARLNENAELLVLLKNPKVTFDDKTKLLAKFLGDVNESTLKLVYLLVVRDKINLIGEIREEYQRLLEKHQGIEPAVVITAVPLDDETKSGLVKHLEAIIGKKIVAQYDVDPHIIGGVIVRAGGKLLDCSTRSRLMALKKELCGIRR